MCFVEHVAVIDSVERLDGCESSESQTCHSSHQVVGDMTTCIMGVDSWRCGCAGMSTCAAIGSCRRGDSGRFS